MFSWLNQTRNFAWMGLNTVSHVVEGVVVTGASAIAASDIYNVSESDSLSSKMFGYAALATAGSALLRNVINVARMQPENYEVFSPWQAWVALSFSTVGILAAEIEHDGFLHGSSSSEPSQEGGELLVVTGGIWLGLTVGLSLSHLVAKCFCPAQAPRHQLRRGEPAESQGNASHASGGGQGAELSNGGGAAPQPQSAQPPAVHVHVHAGGETTTTTVGGGAPSGGGDPLRQRLLGSGDPEQEIPPPSSAVPPSPGAMVANPLVAQAGGGTGGAASADEEAGLVAVDLSAGDDGQGTPECAPVSAAPHAVMHRQAPPPQQQQQQVQQPGEGGPGQHESAGL